MSNLFSLASSEDTILTVLFVITSTVFPWSDLHSLKCLALQPQCRHTLQTKLLGVLVSHSSAYYCCISLVDLSECCLNSNSFFIKQAFGTISFSWRNGDSPTDGVSVFSWELVTKRSERIGAC